MNKNDILGYIEASSDDMMSMLDSLLVESNEKHLAKTKLYEATMWAMDCAKKNDRAESQAPPVLKINGGNVCRCCPMEGIGIEEAVLMEESIELTRELRPCLASGEKGYFHMWGQYFDMIGPSVMVGGHSGGQIGGVRAIVELENGTIHLYCPEKITFIDMEGEDDGTDEET